MGAGVVPTLFDPARGTGGMLSVSEDYVRQLNPQAQLRWAPPPLDLT